MERKSLEKIINKLMNTGADFGEIYYEDTHHKRLNYIDSKLDKVVNTLERGISFRIALNNDVYFSTTNNINQDNLDKVISLLTKNINENIKFSNIRLNRLTKFKSHAKINHNDMSDINKRKYLHKFDELIRSKDNRIAQVSLSLEEIDSNITIVNHTGLYKKENRVRTILYVKVNFKDDNLNATSSFSYGKSAGYEIFSEIDMDKVANDLVASGIDKLYAKACVGMEMPVILESGFGAVLFHEACGHAMEATSVADNLSILSGKLNTKIASDKVTIIDDGTIDNLWGTTNIDDEGNDTRKNLLIKNGILVNYLIDTLNNRKMHMNITGSSRRESYKYAPTSRMNNTYLCSGNDSVADMIKSIDLGLYAKKLGGGCVSTETGDFNFNVTDAYMIRDGKITECVKSASLIGNTQDILNNVEMVSDNLEFDNGMCGSISGWVNVTIGEPTIKISKILVGGEKND